MIKLADILLEKEGLIGKYAFVDKEADNERGLAKLQGVRWGAEENTPEEQDYYNSIHQWLTQYRDSDLYDDLKNKIDTLAKQYPIIFKPETKPGTPLYRGLDSIGKKTLQQLKSTTQSNWIKMKEDYWFCNIPISYKPRRKVQSWSHKITAAEGFASDGILVTRQDSGYFFNWRALAAIYGRTEYEIIHFGMTYTNPVYVAVSDFYYDDEIKPALQPKTSLSFQTAPKLIKVKTKK